MKHIPTLSTLACVLGLFLTVHPASANTASWSSSSVPLGTNIVDGITFPFVPPGPVIGNLDGFIVNDLIMNTTIDWTATFLQVNLTSGSIFQEKEGFGQNGVTLGQTDPNGFSFLPSSEFDSYIFDPHGGAQIQSACAAIGPCPHTQFDTSTIDISWNSAGADTSDLGIFSIARVTLSPDANGTAFVASLVSGAASRVETDFLIQNGHIVPVPEPASVLLLGLSGLGLMRRRSCRGGEI